MEMKKIVPRRGGVRPTFVYVDPSQEYLNGKTLAKLPLLFSSVCLLFVELLVTSVRVDLLALYP